MATLVPMPFETLLGWALTGLERERSVFGLPRRSFWTGAGGLDLSIELPAGRVETPLGPAAGPHTQLAHNIVVAWLAGSRVLELKTVQVNDRIQVPRPCIDAPREGYNVEWSQELTLAESLDQYVAAWALVHVLAARGVAGDATAARVLAGHGLDGTQFHASVGYDLAGIRSANVARFLDGLEDASARLATWRRRLPRALAAAADVPIPPRVARTVTLSTFHGCPAEEIERIVEYLFARHDVHVVVKLNPTLLGRNRLERLLHERLGYRDLDVPADAFAQDLPWDEAMAMIRRLTAAGQRRGLGFGVKLTNTLVVRNRRRRLAGDVVYLSGPPLHPIALALAERLAGEVDVPMSFSAGVCAENFPDTVASGFGPVTTCTDLLRPTGYRRLPRYLKALEAELRRTGAASIDEYRRDRGAEAVASARADAHGEPRLVTGAPSGWAEALTAAEGARLHRRAYLVRVIGDPRYHAEQPATPATARPPLHALDCDACNQCTVACPNGAIVAVAAPPARIETADLVIEGAHVTARPAVLTTRCESQWVVFADFCNACGNCDTFCPESGGPQWTKPRMHGARAGFDAEAPEDGIRVEGDSRIVARFLGTEHRLARRAGGWTFDDGVIEATLDEDLHLRSARALELREGHMLPLARAHALRMWVEGARATLTPVAAAWGAREPAVPSMV